MLFNQKSNKSKSVAGDLPFNEGYVTELGLVDKSRQGQLQEKAKQIEAKLFVVDEMD